MMETIDVQGGRSSIPIAVQTFPTTDDFTFEKEKQSAASLSGYLFESYEREFLQRLSSVHEQVESHMTDFFDSISRAYTSKGKKRAKYVSDALEELAACSPKKILAEFQRQSLVAGWAYVSVFNATIDRLAEAFPRCRAGIFATRLKYSDVLQISSEITETLRACSTLIDDLQRRYEMLESLQKDVQTDIETPESEIIVAAVKETFRDNARYGKDAAAGVDDIVKKLTSYVMQPVTALGDALAIPSLQIQGQMLRTRRMVVFLETAKMLAEGWNDWKTASSEIIIPNLNVMFSLKRDFFQNQVLCLCDIVTCNGYELSNLAGMLYDAAANRRLNLSKCKVQTEAKKIATMCRR